MFFSGICYRNALRTLWHLSNSVAFTLRYICSDRMEISCQGVSATLLDFHVRQVAAISWGCEQSNMWEGPHAFG